MSADEATRPAGGAARAVAALLLLGGVCLPLAAALLTGLSCPKAQHQGQQGGLKRQDAPGPQQGGLPWQPLAAYYQVGGQLRAVQGTRCQKSRTVASLHSCSGHRCWPLLHGERAALLYAAARGTCGDGPTRAPGRPSPRRAPQAFARPRAVREALRLFRQHYPDARVLVVNDGGDPSLAGVVAPFNVSYHRHPAITTTGHAAGFRVTQGCNSTAACREFAFRLVEAASGADWLLLLEDDVRVLRLLSLHQMRHDINQGGPVGRVFSPAYRKAIERLRGRPRRKPDTWRGAGGSVFRGSALRALAAEWDDAWLPPLLALNDGMLPVDKLLTSLIFIRGGTHGSWPGYAWLGYRNHDELVAQGLAERVHGTTTLYGAG